MSRNHKVRVCGTYSKYKGGCRCAPCVEAFRKYQREHHHVLRLLQKQKEKRECQKKSKMQES